VTGYVDLLDRPVKDCLIRAKVRKISGHTVGFILRYDDRGFSNAYFVDTDPGAEWGGIGRQELASRPYQWLWKRPAGAPVPQPQDGYFEIAFAAIGDSLTTYVNGKSFGEVRDETHRTAIPCIYVFNWGKPALAVFKTIQIQVLDKEATLGSTLVPATAGSSGSGEAKRSYTDPTPGGEGRGENKRSPPPPAVAPFDATQARKHQEAWAKYLGVPVEETNSIGMKLVLIPPGEFEMGSTPEEIAWALEEGKKNNERQGYFDVVPSEGPRHRVKITMPFHLGMYHVTQDEYEKVMGVNPSGYASTGTDATKVTGKDTSRHPVETVNWDDCVEFCRRLSALPAEQAARRVYRLPTEAEWEYACRAGTTTRWSCGDDEAGLVECAWFKTNADGVTHPVGQKKPNAWGLYDMHGNVWQWCLDWFSQDYYKQSPPDDPPGPPAGSDRVLRGGALGYTSSNCRSAYRGSDPFANRSIWRGFRVVVGR